ncbi:aspartic peptidase domain-containing protein [Irpex rosettiformis]|uniref:Aspartic peptidase domain-containing protein n=1 Tax=Irpex rosettiformis TaxID=378272 RepID=A0ACB8UEC2_9APHY|nr:aspartic peptidase domain-containing protein [Irpex rosettiformis]
MSTCFCLDYLLQLDTGSSDLWVKGPSSPLPNAQSTSISWNLTYGIGWASGNVSYAPVEFAGISIPTQAYLDVSAALNPALQYGAQGIIGLGFTSLSTVDALVNHTGSDKGRSLLYSLFNDNKDEPNFISFALQRTSDPNDVTEGTFSIGEVVQEHSDILNSTAIPTFPEAYPTRWNVLLEALIVGENTVAVSSVVDGAPSGKAVVLLDSGTSYTYAPPEICTAIYGSIPNATYDSSAGQWKVPCDQEVNIALQFGGKAYAIHPLDVSPQSLTNSGECIGTFVPQSVAVGAGEFDWLIGDNVLRSIYSVYDFGDFQSDGSMGNPYVKLLSLVDPNKASAEFHQLRGGAAATNITYNASNTTSETSSSSGSSSGSVKVSDDIANTITKLNSYLPAMLAVMALNAFVILLLVVAAFVYMCRRRSAGKARARKNPGRMTPMPMNPTSTSSFTDMMHGDSAPEPVYQPVSMALTEDTFVPPSPAFQKDGFGGKLRPVSVA